MNKGKKRTHRSQSLNDWKIESLERDDENERNKRARMNEASHDDQNTSDSNMSDETENQPAKSKFGKQNEAEVSNKSLIDADVEIQKKKKENGPPLKSKCALTDELSKYFDEMKELDANSNLFTAICTICKERKSFVRGNTSNLKTHMKRVSFRIHSIFSTRFSYSDSIL